jgi:glycolate oxidase
MDATTVAAVNRLTRMGLPETTQALLLAGFDTPDPAPDLAAVGELCRAAGASEVVPADDEAESEMLLAGRRASLSALEAVRGTTMIDDVCVPRARLAELLDGVAAIAERHDLTIGVVCFDAADPDEARRARASFDEVMALGLELGGTITGEHGVGVLKREWLARELGPDSLELQRGIKRLFDPRGILNPGKVL